MRHQKIMITSGALGGFLQGLAGMGGPPIVTILVARNDSDNETRGNILFLMSGHVTKTGDVAGPKILEHMVDVVLNFEGQKTHLYRILRSKKNRFGSTAKVGVYEMVENGLQPVLNPSTILINDRNSEKFRINFWEICRIVYFPWNSRGPEPPSST